MTLPEAFTFLIGGSLGIAIGYLCSMAKSVMMAENSKEANMIWNFQCPSGWEVIRPWGDGYALRQKSGALRVIVDCEVKADGSPWLHVSVSRKSWTPTHEDMALVKRDFIGDDRYAYSIWPPKEQYVNIHPHCLHLWARWDTPDGRVLPEFSAELEVIGRSV